MATRFAIAAVGVLSLALVGMRFGPDVAEATQQNQAAAPQQPMPGMMKMHEQMTAEMKSADATLEALVKDMNAATGDAKINAVAAVVTELVQQHRAMHGRMEEMHQHMMGMGRGMMPR
jgi:ABC-type glycerol-3-phosphate transport system substrate-binding protein